MVWLSRGETIFVDLWIEKDTFSPSINDPPCQNEVETLVSVCTETEARRSGWVGEDVQINVMSLWQWVSALFLHVNHHKWLLPPVLMVPRLYTNETKRFCKRSGSLGERPRGYIRQIHSKWSTESPLSAAGRGIIMSFLLSTSLPFSLLFSFFFAGQETAYCVRSEYVNFKLAVEKGWISKHSDYFSFLEFIFRVPPSRVHSKITHTKPRW